MLIKSQSRKEASFAQLVSYIADRAERDEAILHNLFARDKSGVVKEFEENARHLKARKGGNFMFHEILSISLKEGIEAKELRSVKETFRHVAEKYIAKRAPDALVYAALHDDHKHHLHYHLMISANNAGSEKRLRLSKSEFDGIKRSLENEVLSEMQELGQKVTMGKKAREKLSKKGGELKRRTGKTPERDNLSEKLKEVFSASSTREEFFSRLSQMNIEIYVRGQTVGFVDLSTGRKHRLRTLGLEDEFEAMSLRLEFDRKARSSKAFDAEETEDAQSTKKQDHEAEEMPPENEEKEQAGAKEDEVKHPLEAIAETAERVTQAAAKVFSPKMEADADDEKRQEIERRRAEIERARSEKDGCKQDRGQRMD